MLKIVIFEDKICLNCNKSFNRNRLPCGRLENKDDFIIRKCCSRNCSRIFFSGKNHHNYKDGIRRGHDCGYLRYTDGRYIHRVVIENYLGRKLNNNEHLHHINGDVTDNRIENLEIYSNSEHRKLHCKTQTRNKKDGRFN